MAAGAAAEDAGVENNVAAAVAVPVKTLQAALIAMTFGAVGEVAAGVPLASAVATALDGGYINGKNPGAASPRGKSCRERVSQHAAAGPADQCLSVFERV